MIKAVSHVIVEKNILYFNSIKCICNFIKYNLKENSSEVEQWFPKPKVKGSNPFFLVNYSECFLRLLIFRYEFIFLKIEDISPKNNIPSKSNNKI